jgi:hypothetical protein
LTVSGTQTNGLSFGKSWLDFPAASLLEYDGKVISIYESGNRPLTAEEQAIIDGMPKDQKQSEIDMLTDGSTMYHREKRYFAEQDAEWYWGKWHKVKRYSSRDNTIYDKKAKGALSLQYEIVQD